MLLPPLAVAWLAAATAQPRGRRPGGVNSALRKAATRGAAVARNKARRSDAGVSASLNDIEKDYNLSKASAGREAIDEALNFVSREQRTGSSIGQSPARVVETLLNAKGAGPGDDEVALLTMDQARGLPTCNLTKRVLRDEGVFLYRRPGRESKRATATP